jgi:uncharacterized protein YegL
VAIEKRPEGLRTGSIKSPLQQRIEAAATNPTPQSDPATAENRIALLLDASGSMSGSVTDKKSKAELLHDAVETFVNATDFTKSAVAIETFPKLVSLPLCAEPIIVIIESKSVKPTGCTPMSEAMETALQNIPMTRGVIVSDGQADSPGLAIEQARTYKEVGIPIDTVHIGRSDAGEETLKTIAEITGGIYIKFTNVTEFAKNFKWLSPQLRSTLLGLPSKDRAKLLGAEEVK